MMKKWVVWKSPWESPEQMSLEFDSPMNKIAPLSRFDEFIAILTLFIFFSFLLSLPFVYLLCFFLVVHTKNVYALMFILISLSSIYHHERVPNTWQAFIDMTVWKYWCKYFDFKVMVESDIELHPQKLYCLVHEPHGTFSMGQWLFVTCQQHVYPDLRPTKGLVSSSIFLMPLVRNIWGWLGCVPATRARIAQEYKDHNNIALIPGGVRELFLSQRDGHDNDASSDSPSGGQIRETEEHIFLLNRKGFIREAIRHGVDLVPIYHLGNTQLFYRLSHPIMTHLSRRTGCAIFLFFGRCCLPIPYRVRLTMVVGKPVEVLQSDQPSKEQIEETHARFVKAMCDLYNKAKTSHGWTHKRLVVH